MAASLPVVCTCVGSLPEMLDEGVAFVPTGDPAAIASALRTLRRSAEQRERMGKRNRTIAESRFAFQVVTKALDRLYG